MGGIGGEGERGVGVHFHLLGGVVLLGWFGRLFRGERTKIHLVVHNVLSAE